MLPDTLYGFSQLCSMVETTTLGLALLFVGNAKVARLHCMKKVKLMLSIVMLLVGGLKALQWSMQLHLTNPLADEALNITFVITASYLICLAYIPLASPSHLTPPRLRISIATIVAYNIFIWVVLLFFPTLFQIILFISSSLFFIELARVNIVFFHNYKMQRETQPEPGSEEEKRWICLNMVAHSFIVLSVCSALFVFFIILIQKFKAIYYLAMLPVWGYLFVYIVNRIMKLNPLLINNISNEQPVIEQEEKATLHSELSYKVNQWMEKGGYRLSGITMEQVAQELNTNRFYLSQYINTRYGCNFKTWIAELRINYAKQLLVTTSITIDMVASRAGFSSKAQLTSAFKAHEGCTPGVWRQKNLK